MRIVLGVLAADAGEVRWDGAWFLIWGVCLGLAVLLYRRPRQPAA